MQSNISKLMSATSCDLVSKTFLNVIFLAKGKLSNWIVLYVKWHGLSTIMQKIGKKNILFLLAVQWPSQNTDLHLLEFDKYIHAGRSRLYWTLNRWIEKFFLQLLN